MCDNMIPKISIIIPVYNVEEYLKQCLDSVINQTFKDIEIIIVNDGSTDNSINIIEEYKERDSRIIFLNQENHGPGYARNSGLKIAKGEYILFIDSDDWIREDTLQELYEIVKNDKNIDLIIFQYVNYDDEKDKFYDEEFDSELKKYVNKTFNYEDVSNIYLQPNPNMKFYKKSLIEENNIQFPEELFFEDKPFHTEIVLQSNKIYYTDKTYFFRRRRQGSVTAKADDILFDSVKISNLVVNVYKKSGKYEQYMKNVINAKISYLKYCYRIIRDEYKQDYLELLANDFDKIKSDKNTCNEYLSCLSGINREFFIKVDKNIKYQDLDYLLSNFKYETKITFNSFNPTTIGEEVELTGNLTDIEGRPLYDTQMKMFINDAQKTIKTDENGCFRQVLTMNKIGKNILSVQYPGNKKYRDSELSKTFEISKIKTIISVNSFSPISLGDKVMISGNLVDMEGNPLSNTQLKLFINEGQKTIKTDQNGDFSHLHKMNKLGTNNITFQYMGNNTYQGNTLSTKIEVNKIKTKINMDLVEKVMQDDVLVFNGNVTTINNDPLSKVQIRIFINDSPKTLKVDENGNFNFSFRMHNVGINDVKVIYNGNNTYEKCIISKKVEVFK